jgi:hypothetical protein
LIQLPSKEIKKREREGKKEGEKKEAKKTSI